jgi:signal transduction histidine kinase
LKDTLGTRWLLWTVTTIFLLLIAATVARLAYNSWQQRRPYFHGDFVSDSDGRTHQAGWQAYGGTWQVVDGAMQNISDDRGAKLMSGNPHWHNYMVEADIQLLGETGDAGFVVRATHEEVGVDSYHGYFAGLRDLDETLILGRADYGWHEFRSIPIHPGVYTGTWYHLKVIAYECTLAVSATTEKGETTVTSVHDPNCIEDGRFGLQSYSTGAVWRKVELRPATENDLNAMLGGQVPAGPDQAPFIAGIADPLVYSRYSAPMQRELKGYQTDLSAVPIASLRLLAPEHSSHVTIQGVVTLLSPTLFVQDSSGGISIPQPHTNHPVQIGDAVEASGDAEQHDFSAVLRNASVRQLWSHASVPPVAVTASQAATGAFDAQFIETEGRLEAEQHIGGKSVIFKLNEGSQSFVAIAENQGPAEMPRGFEIGSRLRLLGICVTDRAFAQNEMPFALLMRSVEDAQMIEPPPWWNTQHIVELVVGLLILSLGIQLAYASVKRSQLHAVIEERERLALEMHDTLAQSFAGLGFQLEALCEETDQGSAIRKQLESTVDLVHSGHMEARRNIAALRPENLDQMGLANALELAARAIVHGGPIAISMSVRGDPRPVPLRICDTIFRIGQEAIANAVRHGHPRTIHLQLVYGRPSVKLTVRDDGDGFSMNDDFAGFGIRGMKRRAGSIDANLRIRSSPGRGTSVHVRATLPQSLLSTWWWRVIRNREWKRVSHGETA